jgi:GTP cyclohydrolase I
VASVIGEGVFAEEHDGMVMVRDIEFYSLCEHHLLPFHGRAHVAYVPDGRILGLSKVARVVDIFARRFQVQERLTDQVADAIQGALAPRGVGVVLQAEHMCMSLRGVRSAGTTTVTSAFRGALRDDDQLRARFAPTAH